MDGMERLRSFLSFNLISSIPTHIGLLTNLNTLCAHPAPCARPWKQLAPGNILVVLTFNRHDVILNLSHMHSALTGNVISSLPTEIGLLTSLQNLSARHTPAPCARPWETSSPGSPPCADAHLLP